MSDFYQEYLQSQIVDEKIIAYLEEYGKVNTNELAAGLDMAGAEKFPKLIKEISKLESQGKLRFDDHGNLALHKKVEKKKEITVAGVFRASKAGLGFLAVDENEDDMFVGRNDVGHAVDGDTVEAVVKKLANRLKGTATEVRIVGVAKRSLKTVVGKFILDDKKPKCAGYIRSKNQKTQQKIYIEKESVLLDGTEIIKVDIDKYPTRDHDCFVGHVCDIVGHQGDVGIDVPEVLESTDIKSEFPEDVMAEADAAPDAPSEKNMIECVDLRNEITFTIDGADARDLDDAVHIKLLNNGNFELGVYIADVSYYITEGFALNRKAIARGTSVYVTDRVVPILPERLSNGICSLNPNVDHLTQSCLMETDRNGHVVSHQTCQSVIKTTFRMTYSDVNDVIAGNKELTGQCQPIVDFIHHIAALHNIFETMRVRHGAPNFDTSEAKIIVNDKGMSVDIVLRQRGIAECTIESFMLAASETIAEHFAKRKLPFIYRIHEELKTGKLQKFLDYASIFGVQIHGTANKITQQTLQDFMAKVEGKPGAEVLDMMLLRSMQQTCYSEHNHGHYGLAAEYYTHFTSPIRRYPDLFAHRMIREYTQFIDEKIEYFRNVIPELATSSLTLERRVIDAERVVEAMKKAEYTEEYVGQEFDGAAASVVKFGMFIESPNTIEGLVHIATLPEFYNYNERTSTLQSEKSGKVFRVGQPIKIKLTRANKETGDIDFEYIPSEYDMVGEVKESRKDRSGKEKCRPKANNHKGLKSNKPRNRKSSTSTSRKSGKKSFYKGVAKKKSHKTKK